MMVRRVCKRSLTALAAIILAVLLFSMAMLVATGLIAGLLPAVQAWRSDVLSATREETRSTRAC